MQTTEERIDARFQFRELLKEGAFAGLEVYDSLKEEHLFFVRNGHVRGVADVLPTNLTYTPHIVPSPSPRLTAKEHILELINEGEIANGHLYLGILR